MSPTMTKPYRAGFRQHAVAVICAVDLQRQSLPEDGSELDVKSKLDHVAADNNLWVSARG